MLETRQLAHRPNNSTPRCSCLTGGRVTVNSQLPLAFHIKASHMCTYSSVAHSVKKHSGASPPQHHTDSKFPATARLPHQVKQFVHKQNHILPSTTVVRVHKTIPTIILPRDSKFRATLVFNIEANKTCINSSTFCTKSSGVSQHPLTRSSQRLETLAEAHAELHGQITQETSR
jgi:hypothetical protein